MTTAKPEPIRCAHCPGALFNDRGTIRCDRCKLAYWLLPEGAGAPPPTTSAPEVEKLCKLMVAHSLVELKVGTVHLRRAPPEPKEPSGESRASELERILKMSPDKQEAALMLQKIGGR